MADALKVFVPLFGFMLIPVWIPLVAMAWGAVVDRLVPQSVTAAGAAVEAAKARSAELHADRAQVGASPRHAAVVAEPVAA